jgi:hypothetical protein
MHGTAPLRLVVDAPVGSGFNTFLMESKVIHLIATERKDDRQTNAFIAQQFFARVVLARMVIASLSRRPNPDGLPYVEL